jgi:hypothetical protein
MKKMIQTIGISARRSNAGAALAIAVLTLFFAAGIALLMWAKGVMVTVCAGLLLALLSGRKKNK